MRARLNECPEAFKRLLNVLQRNGSQVGEVEAGALVGVRRAGFSCLSLAHPGELLPPGGGLLECSRCGSGNSVHDDGDARPDVPGGLAVREDSELNQDRHDQ